MHRWLAFIADPVTDGESNLFVIDTDAATPTAVQVNAALPANGDVDTSDGFRFSGIPLPVALNAPFPTNGDVSQGSSSFATDEVVVDRNNRGVFFMADGVTDGVESMFFSSFSAPGTMTNLAPNLSTASDVNSFLLSKDGSLVVWSGDPTASAVDEIYAVNVSGATFSAPARVNGALVTGGDVDTGASSTSRDYDIVGDGLGVIYVADQITDLVDQPFFTPVASGVPGTSAALISPDPSGDAFQVYR